MPGGYVYFTREILAYFNNEAQLGLGIASILSEDFRRYSGLAGLGVQLLFLKFSRDDERQADDLGTEYATKTGYDTRQLARFFHTLDRLNPGNAGSRAAAILLLLAEESSPQRASDLFAQRSEASVLQKENERINGMDAVRLLSEVTAEQNRLRVLSYFIRKDGRVFVFHGYTSVSLFGRYGGAFRHTMAEFDHLRDGRILNLRPDRVQVRRAPSYGSLQQALTALGTPRDRLEQLSILNGMNMDDAVKRGTLLKTITRR